MASPALKKRFPVPESIPGEEVYDKRKLELLKRHMANICKLSHAKFPGSQPVSFSKESFDLLENEDFWVCEKSDGLRLMIMILSRPNGVQEIYLIDRKERFWEVQGLRFPHQDGFEFNHSNTIIDGELVIDLEKDNFGQEVKVLRYLAFDCIVLDNESLMHRSLSSRYGRLKSWVIEPMVKYLQQFPQERSRMPFDVLLKPMELSYGIQKVLDLHVPQLKHGNDGLIFTSAESVYTMGTDRKILKWKPPSENSIDFRLELRFPPKAQSRTGGSRNSVDSYDVDLRAKPAFLLMMNTGMGEETFFDWLDMTDKEWEDWKARGEQLDNRIVEVVWNAVDQNWNILRFRDDKHEGNYSAIVHKIIDSIMDGVESSDLIKKAPRIQQRWQERKGKVARPPPPQPPPQQQHQSLPLPLPPSTNAADMHPPQPASEPPLAGARPTIPSPYFVRPPAWSGRSSDFEHLLHRNGRDERDHSWYGTQGGHPLRLPFSNESGS